MAHVISPLAELNEERTKETLAEIRSAPVDSSSFKYYIHDSVTTLSFQLIGDMRSGNVTELNGSWETAQPTLENRRLVLDLSLLHSTDEQSRHWLLSMKELGATLLPGMATAHARSGEAFSLLAKFLDTFKPKP